MSIFGFKKNRSTWPTVFRELLITVVLIGTLRWIVAEPFLVPSGSMIPSLLIKDYIVATKFDFGVRVPFTKLWLIGPKAPERGNVVVFKSKNEKFYFMVKRVIGRPGDKISFQRESRELKINGKVMNLTALAEDFGQGVSYLEDDALMWEDLGTKKHLVRYQTAVPDMDFDVDLVVPEGHLFVMGDNRDRSSDSRSWGFLPIENLMGKARWIWMSCDGDSPESEILCSGSHIRMERLFKSIQ